MKFISWNVNGLRACVGKGFLDYFNFTDADFVCLQETKLQPEQISLELEGYEQFWNSAVRKGYSGTAIFTKHKPLNVSYGMPNYIDDEGRLITLEYDNFYLVTSYTPNSQSELARIDYRMAYEDLLREYLVTLNINKPVVFCGDLNVAHTEIDLKNPKSNQNNAGFSIYERNKFTQLLEAGFTDSFRFLHKDVIDAYTWWSYRFSARSKNIGWRIDYFVVSNDIKDKIVASNIHNDILGSDHCPVEIILDI